MIIDGKAIAETIYDDLKDRIGTLPAAPVLCDIVVGRDPVQEQFVRVKARRAAEVGIDFRVHAIAAPTTTAAVVQAVSEAVASGAHGVIVQLPLPTDIDSEAVLAAIPPAVDVDGLVPGSHFDPPTARAVLRILDSLGIDWDSRQCVVVGQGRLVGKPVTRLLQARGCAVVVADVMTPDVPALVRSAEVVVSAVGKPGLITTDMLRPEAVVVDAGTSESGGSILGDVAPAALAHVAFATPVPGGVGPVTVALLMEHVVRRAEQVVDKVH